MVPPGATAVTEALCVMERSAPWIWTEAVAVLLARFGSVPVSLTLTEFVIVEPTMVSGLTDTITVKTTEPVAKFPFAVQMIAPVAPTAGVVPQVHPAGGVADTKSVPAGVFCVSVAPPAEAAPAFVTVSVYGMFAPVATGLGAAVSATERSGV